MAILGASEDWVNSQLKIIADEIVRNNDQHVKDMDTLSTKIQELESKLSTPNKQIGETIMGLMNEINTFNEELSILKEEIKLSKDSEDTLKQILIERGVIVKAPEEEVEKEETSIEKLERLSREAKELRAKSAKPRLADYGLDKNAEDVAYCPICQKFVKMAGVHEQQTSQGPANFGYCDTCKGKLYRKLKVPKVK